MDGILLQAGAQAFGSGAHPSTRLAARALMELEATPKTVLDMGCGSGILSLLAAARWPGARLLAVDSAEEAVATARGNFQANGVGAEALRSQGFAKAQIAARGPFDLILCNILAEPIIAMAQDMAQATRAGSRVILSGILAWLEPQAREAYLEAGFAPEQCYAQESWRCLTMTREG